jgi:hypothetical protein
VTIIKAETGEKLIEQNEHLFQWRPTFLEGRRDQEETKIIRPKTVVAAKQCSNLYRTSEADSSLHRFILK